MSQRPNRLFPRAGLLLFACVMIPSLLLRAQTTTGSIVGTVTDSTGGVIPGCTVTVTSEDTGARRTTTTSDQGTFSFELLRVGQYAVEAEMTGFKKARVSDILLQVDQTVRTNLSLEVGEMSQTVNVTSEVALVKTDQSDVGAVIESKKILQLPLNGRQFIQLATLAPGTMSVTKVDAIMEIFGGNIVANGASSNANQVTMDGVENQDFLVPRLGVRPNPDSIQEFKLMTADYSAEYGRAAGANINLVTKSGTNEWHGSAFEFLRNDRLDSRNFFDPVGKPLPEFKWNQFGGTLGGPIKKDKTFFFFSYEGFRIRRGLTINATVPTDAQRAGDMTWLTPNGVNWKIYDPLTTKPDPATPGNILRDAFLGNVIPAQRISPQAQKLIEFFYPRAQKQVPNEPNYISNPTQIEDQNQVILRLDHQINDNSLLWGRYAWNSNPRLMPTFGSSGLPGMGTDFNFYQQNLVIAYNRTVSPTVVNDVRAGYNRFQQFLRCEARRRDWIGEIGINGALRDGATWGPPNVSSNMSGVGCFQFSPSTPTSNTFEGIDTLAWTRGVHSMKMGADVKRTHQNGIQFPNSRGVYGFGGGFTQLPAERTSSGLGIADLLLGFPSSTSISLGKTDNDIRLWNVGLFFQDDWDLSRNFTVNLGIRYEYMPWGASYRDRISVWSEQKQAIVLAQNNLNQPTTAPGMEGRTIADTLTDFPFFNFMTRDQAGYPKALVYSDNNNFSPRVGFAWRIFGNNDTVLRGGYGMFYEVIAGNIHWNESAQIPYSRNLGFSQYAYDIPTITFANPFLGTAVQGLPGIGGSPTLNWLDPFQSNWNVMLQRKLIRGVSLEAGYVGAKGTGQNLGVDWNAPVFGTGNSQPRRPHPERGSTQVGVPWGARWYNSLQSKLEVKTDSLSVLGSYTWAKALTVGGGGINENNSGAVLGWNTFGARTPVLEGRVPSDDWFLADGKRPGVADMRHRLSVAYVWEVPFGKGRRFDIAGPVDWVLGGWEFTGVTTFETGVPLTACGSCNRNGDPNNGQKKVEKWFDNSVFTLARSISEWDPATMEPADRQLVYQFIGNAGYMNVVGPGVQLWDIGVIKNFPVKDKYNVQFRWEMFNAFNHPSFGQPSGGHSLTPNAGRIYSASRGREMQAALRFSF
ncbi:MAG: carboxypeptidase regulatory-like domain-containing protein [Acidobacteriota bacterium]